MSDEEDETVSEGFSASEDEWMPGKSGGKHDDGESSDDDDSDFEELAGAGSAKSQATTRKRETKNHLKGTGGGGVVKKRKPMGQSLRARLYNKYRPPPKTLQTASGSGSPRASTSSTASKNALTPNEVSAIIGDQEDDGSSSDSSVGNLVNPADLDLRSSFFNIDDKDVATAPPVFDCNAGITNLSDSNSEKEKQEASEDEQKTSKAFDFRNLLETANCIERMKEQIAKQSSHQKLSKAKKPATEDVTTLLALGEKQHLKDKIINPDDEDDEDDDADGDEDARAPSKLNKTKSTRIKRHKKTRPASTVISNAGAGDSDSDDSDLEEVAGDNEDEEEQQNTKNVDGLEIFVEPGTRKRSKEEKTQEELEMAFRRRLNRDLKDQQLLLHKASLLCLFGRSYHYNRLLNDTNLMQAALKILPGAKSYPKESGTELKYFQSFVTWFRTAIKLTSPNLYPKQEEIGNTSKDITEQLIAQIKRGQARCKQDMVFIFIALLRGMGIQCRLIVNMQPLALKPPQQDLLPIKLKPDNKKTTEKDKKPDFVTLSTKKEKDKLGGVTKSLTTNDKQNTNDKSNNKKTHEKIMKPKERKVKDDKKDMGKLEDTKHRSTKHNSRGKVPENPDDEINEKLRTKSSKEEKSKEENASKRKKGKSLREQLKRNLATMKEPGENPWKSDHNRSMESEHEEHKKELATGTQMSELKKTYSTRKNERRNNNIGENIVAKDEKSEKQKGKTEKKKKSLREQLERNLATMTEPGQNPWQNDRNSSPKTLKKKTEPKNSSNTQKVNKSRPKRISNEKFNDAIEAKKSKSDNDHSITTKMNIEELNSSTNLRTSCVNSLDSGVHSEESIRQSIVMPLEENLVVPKVVIENENGKEYKAKPNICPTVTRSRSRSRSISPRPLIATGFLETKKYKEKFSPEPKPKQTPTKPKSKETKPKISTDFLKNSQQTTGRILRSRQNLSSNEANTKTSANDKLNIPQLDGANDDLEYEKSNSKENTSQTSHKQKKSRSKSTDSDEDFQPSPTKQPKRAPVLPKAINQLRKDRRVLSTDNDSDALSESPSKSKKGTAADIWAEVWSDVENRWICIDLFHGKLDSVESIRKSTSSPLAYVFAFQNDLSLKDVTARYCLHWSNVIRKDRVPKAWLETAISAYYGIRTERDIREDHELRRIHEEKEMPKSIAEFKDHPLYALERHLLKFQGIYPPDAPKFGFTSRGDPIYSRDCVHVLHSREIWLKQARTVKLGEKPYKIVKSRPKWDRLTQTVIKDIPLEIFGFWQTEDYEPPTAKNGIVPRNAYGNVELFKECMLPKKTVHIRLPGLNRICKKLGIDCANAVIGFDFHQGSCHPTFDGFVVCEEFADQVTAAWYQDQEEQDRKEKEKYDARVYGNWKKLIRGLLIRERLKKKYNF